MQIVDKKITPEKLRQMSQNMPNLIHKELLVSGRWFKLSLVEQMANIGSDVGRAIQSQYC